MLLHELEYDGCTSIKLVAVKDNDIIILYDIFIDNKWQGSRRTISQCKTFLGMQDHQEVNTVYLKEVKL